MMGPRTERARRLAAAACLLLAAAASCGASSAEAVIHKHPLVRAAAGVLAVGFVLAGAYYIHRRRAGLGLSIFPGRPRLPRNAERLTAEQFYARLLDAVRDSLARSTAHRIRAVSPTELAALEVLPPDADLRARWGDVCARAAEAIARQPEPDREQMARDLEMARDLLKALGRGVGADEDAEEW